MNSVNTDITKGFHRRSQDFSKGGGGALCVKLRVLVCLDIFKLKRHGKKGGHGEPQDPPWLRPWISLSLSFFRTLSLTSRLGTNQIGACVGNLSTIITQQV